MSTVMIGVSSLGDAQRRTAVAFRGKKQGAWISFASEELLWKTLMPKRWALLKVMAGGGSLAIREIARRAGREVLRTGQPIEALTRACELATCSRMTERGALRGSGERSMVDRQKRFLNQIFRHRADLQRYLQQLTSGAEDIEDLIPVAAGPGRSVLQGWVS